MQEQAERRKSRSARPSEALSLLLDHARENLGIRAITLGTAAGQLIAGSGDDLDAVAEAGALDAGHVGTWRMKLGDSEVVLTSVGGAMHPELGPGVRRILAA